MTTYGMPSVQMLEKRVLLSVDFDGETLVIRGDQRDQVLQVLSVDNYGAVRVSLDMDGNGSFTDGEDTVAEYSNVKAYDIGMGEGDDTVTIAFTTSWVLKVQRVTVTLGEGDDKVSLRTYNYEEGIWLREPLSIQVMGGQGADDIGVSLHDLSGTTNLAIAAGAGDDLASILYGRSKNRFTSDIHLGTGADRLSTLITSGRTELPGGRVRPASLGSALVNAYGGDGNDWLRADVNSWTFNGESYAQVFAGDLRLGLFGQNGADHLERHYNGGGQPRNVLGDRSEWDSGIPADSVMAGTEGDDDIRVVASTVEMDGTVSPAVQVIINGIAGEPFVPDAPVYVHGLSGDDTISVGPGVVFPLILHGGDGNDTITGSSGNDSILGDLGEDYLAGGSGNDTLVGGDGEDLLFGGPGDDQLYGRGKADTLHGGTGNDTISGGAGYSLTLGEDGDDTLYARIYPDWQGISFRDTVDGGTGHDRYSADSTDILINVEELLA